MKRFIAAVSLSSSLAFSGPLSTNIRLLNRTTEVGASYRRGQIEMGLGFGMPEHARNYLAPSLAYITPVTQGLDLATALAVTVTTEAKSQTGFRLSQTMRINVTEHLKATIGAQYESSVSPVVGWQYTF
jgi:hypothetical protein